MTPSREGPLIPEIGLLALPYHQFKSRWTTPHHVLTRLAFYFHVVWQEPVPHWRERSSVQVPIEAGAGAGTPRGFRVQDPEPWLPDIHRPAWLRQKLFDARLRRGWNHLRRRGCRTLVLHLWHFQFEPALNVGGHDLSVYHIDDEYSFQFEPLPMNPEERRVLETVDQVFAISPGLMEGKGGLNDHMAMVPEGVDYRLYSTPVPPPADLASIPHPRIGYTGTLKVQLDWPLMLELAQRHPEWSFVFVGPRVMPREAEQSTGFDRLIQLRNVHLLGAKSVKDLARYPQHFDVCVMPYLVNGYTDNIFPLKLPEYLASGRPVVGTPVRSLRDFSNLIGLATNADEWSRKLAEALVAPDHGAGITRQETALKYDWGGLVHQIAGTICERLGGVNSARFQHRAGRNPALTK